MYGGRLASELDASAESMAAEVMLLLSCMTLLLLKAAAMSMIAVDVLLSEVVWMCCWMDMSTCSGLQMKQAGSWSGVSRLPQLMWASGHLPFKNVTY
jgi:hypothetical protein